MNIQTKEFLIENQEQTDAIVAAILDNFNKSESDQANIIVRFDSKISVSDLLLCLTKLWKTENDCQHTIDILIKNLSYAHRYKALGLALKTSDLRNPMFLSNIFCLVKGYNSFDESYFDHEQVFINDEVEYLDIFDDLEEELSAVNNKLAEYYISMIKTCNMIDGVDNNPNAVTIEPLYEYLFSAVDVTILAKVLSGVKDSAIWETKKIVLNSLGYLGMVAEKFVFTNTVLDILGKEVFEDSIKAAFSKKDN